MLYDRQEIPELHFIKHFHDDYKQYVDYEKVIFDKSLSPYMFQNDVMNTWLKSLQSLVSMQFDQMNVIKNWRNIMVDKYFYKHNR